MFAPNYKELTVTSRVVKRGEGEETQYVPDLPDLQFGLVLNFVDGQNYYAYPLPENTLGKDCLSHVVYKTEDDKIMQEIPGKIQGDVVKNEIYKALVKTTVRDVKIAEEKARLIQEAENNDTVVNKETLDAVDYNGADAEDSAPVWVFHINQ